MIGCANKPYPIPADEDERLARLAEYQVVGTPTEGGYDHIIELAADLFDTPIALMSLVEKERQWLKARVGLAVEETSRDVSFCAHAIMGEEVFVVPDALHDARFSQNPLVTGAPNIRFYAGAPLVERSGHKLGAVCVIDSKPRDMLTDKQQRVLSSLAKLVMDRLELRHLAHYDQLTNLPNRSLFGNRLTKITASGDRAAMLLLDLDGFKEINDTLGHGTGDALLKAIASRLLSCFGQNETVARFGGDEFAILLPDVNDPDVAVYIAERVLDAFAMPFEADGHNLRMSTSIGMVIAPMHGKTPEDLMVHADLALYKAKADGRNRYQMFVPDLRERAAARLLLKNELHQAFVEGQFKLHYQPQVGLPDGRIAGAEALLRWQHPERGLLYPAAFLPTLEADPLAQAVGDWTIREACRQAARWRDAGLPPIRMGVNLFAAQLRSGRLTDTVMEALTASGLPAEALELEITENIALQYDDPMQTCLSDLRARGVGIAFDDFGTGFASLSMLKRFPLTRLKLDRSFVQDLQTDQRDLAIVEAVLAMGRSLGLQIIAEGIETTSQAIVLTTMQCDEGQGYLYSKPVPAPAFEKLLAGETVDLVPRDEFTVRRAVA